MKICIHRGAEEIGGNCIELEAQGKRIVLDLGRPLDAGRDEEVPLPPIPGLATGDDPSLLGVVISHAHADHWGLVPQIAPTVSVYIGTRAAEILREAAFFSPAGFDLKPAGFLRDRQPFVLGPFTITPFLMDHSAFDAYALLVEADDKRLFYTGDFRGHGRKGKLFERLVYDPPRGVDVLLIEGTNVRTEGEPAVPEVTEDDVERRCIETFKATRGMALVAYSAQNIDRLDTLYRATLQADRDFVMDLYTATMARATGLSSIPQPGPDWPRVRVFVPLKQRIQVKEAGEFERVAWIRSCRVYGEELAAQSSRLVTTFRSSMARDLERAECLQGASLVWSLWRGYLESDARLRAFAERHDCPPRVIHSSGHAFPADLARLADAMRARRTVRIHSAARDAGGVANGEWFNVVEREGLK